MAIDGGSVIYRTSLDSAGLQQGLQGAAKQFGGLGDAASVLLGQINLVEVSVTGIATAAMAAAAAVDGALMQMAFNTGKAGEELAAMNQMVLDIGKNEDETFSQVAQAVGVVTQRLHLSGEAARVAAEKYLTVGHAFKIENTDEFVKLMTSTQAAWGVGPELLDKFVVAAQETGISVMGLAGEMQAFGATFRNMGYGVDEATATLANFEAKGVPATRVIMAFRMALMGLGGDEAALGSAIKRIKELSDAGDKAGAIDLAGKLFKARGASEMIDAIKRGALSANELTEKIKDADGAVDKLKDTTLKAKLEQSWNAVQVAILPIGKQLEDIAKAMLPIATAAIQIAAAIVGNPVVFQILAWSTALKLVTMAISPVIGGIGLAINAWKALALAQTAYASVGFLGSLGKLWTSITASTVAKWEEVTATTKIAQAETSSMTPKLALTGATDKATKAMDLEYIAAMNLVKGLRGVAEAEALASKGTIAGTGIGSGLGVAVLPAGQAAATAAAGAKAAAARGTATAMEGLSWGAVATGVLSKAGAVAAGVLSKGTPWALAAWVAAEVVINPAIDYFTNKYVEKTNAAAAAVKAQTDILHAKVEGSSSKAAEYGLSYADVLQKGIAAGFTANKGEGYKIVDQYLATLGAGGSNAGLFQTPAEKKAAADAGRAAAEAYADGLRSGQDAIHAAKLSIAAIDAQGAADTASASRTREPASKADYDARRALREAERGFTQSNAEAEAKEAASLAALKAANIAKLAGITDEVKQAEAGAATGLAEKQLEQQNKFASDDRKNAFDITKIKLQAAADEAKYRLEQTQKLVELERSVQDVNHAAGQKVAELEVQRNSLVRQRKQLVDEATRAENDSKRALIDLDEQQAQKESAIRSAALRALGTDYTAEEKALSDQRINYALDATKVDFENRKAMLQDQNQLEIAAIKQRETMQRLSYENNRAYLSIAYANQTAGIGDALALNTLFARAADMNGKSFVALEEDRRKQLSGMAYPDQDATVNTGKAVADFISRNLLTVFGNRMDEVGLRAASDASPNKVPLPVSAGTEAGNFKYMQERKDAVLEQTRLLLGTTTNTDEAKLLADAVILREKQFFQGEIFALKNNIQTYNSYIAQNAVNPKMSDANKESRKNAYQIQIAGIEKNLATYEQYQSFVTSSINDSVARLGELWTRNNAYAEENLKLQLSYEDMLVQRKLGNENLVFTTQQKAARYTASLVGGAMGAKIGFNADKQEIEREERAQSEALLTGRNDKLRQEILKYQQAMGFKGNDEETLKQMKADGGIAKLAIDGIQIAYLTAVDKMVATMSARRIDVELNIAKSNAEEWKKSLSRDFGGLMFENAMFQAGVAKAAAESGAGVTQNSLMAGLADKKGIPYTTVKGTPPHLIDMVAATHPELLKPDTQAWNFGSGVANPLYSGGNFATTSPGGNYSHVQEVVLNINVGVDKNGNITAMVNDQFNRRMNDIKVNIGTVGSPMIPTAGR